VHELYFATLKLLENPVEARAIGEAAKRVVDANRGATDRYFDGLKSFF